MRSFFLALLVCLLPCCQREEVTRFQIGKRPAGETVTAAVAQLSPGMQPPPGMAGEVPPPPVPKSGLRWTLPAGWSATAPGGMRYATLKPPVGGTIDVSVVVLQGPAGGELSNVNRWRGQLGLGSIDQAALQSQRKTVQSKAGPVSVFDFLSEGEKKTRMVVGLALFDGNSWFLKMTGDAAAVAASRSDFTRFLQSLHVDTH